MVYKWCFTNKLAFLFLRPVPECTAAVCVETEESSLLQQRQTELKEETQAEDLSTETPSHPETERESSDTDNDDDWEPFSHSGAAGNNDCHTRVRGESSAAQNSGLSQSDQLKETTNNGDVLETAEEAQSSIDTRKKQYSCSSCEKTFRLKSNLTRHLVACPRMHCCVCVKTEESLLLQQRQTELKEETQGEDFSTETHITRRLRENLLTLTMMTTGNHSAIAKPVSGVKAQQHKTLVCPSLTSSWRQQTLETCWKQLKELKATFKQERNHSAV
ncbi:hypothetical protein WMY93_010062 [Mugilogobius chulae]|uniref:C2H2-type domain-containing protein n=1 Tax=Mugilogobius chulae TaxID=88201 RepID=A0AAW0PCK6_9GOBI